MLHLAMFDAVNSIEHRYKPYGVQLVAAPDTSQEAAAASAAGAILMELFPNAAAQIQAAETSYLAKLPDDAAKSAGIRLGQEAAAKILAMRADDGSWAADAYRPKTKPGVYIPTAIAIGWAFAQVRPFALVSSS